MNDGVTTDLLSRRPDQFAALREAALAEAARHGREPDVATYQRAREVATLVAATRASYVLLVNSGFGYLPAHVGATFGHTGQVDVVESDPTVASFVDEMARRQSLGERIRVHLGTAAAVFSSLNGPYDVVVIDDASDERAPRFDDVIRLVRTGGCIAVLNRATDEAPSALLEAIATDARLLSSFPEAPQPALAVRRR